MVLNNRFKYFIIDQAKLVTVDGEIFFNGIVKASSSTYFLDTITVLQLIIYNTSIKSPIRGIHMYSLFYMMKLV